MSVVAHTFRDATRSIRRSRGLFAVGVVCLAIGIGANLVVFQLVDALFLEQPNGVIAPERLARIDVNALEPLGHTSFTTVLSYPDFVDLKEQLVDGDVAGYFRGDLAVEIGVASSIAHVAAVTDDYFTVLGVQPVKGRLFVPGQLVADKSSDGVVVSYAFWQRAFAADSEVLGKTIRVQGQQLAVIGVTHPQFTGLELSPTDLWVPISMAPMLYRGTWASEREPRWLDVIVRIREGATRAKVSGEVSTIYHRADIERQGANSAAASSVRISVGPLLRARGAAPMDQARLAIWLAAASLIVLLLVCVTMGELSAARNVKLRRLMAIRLALGSTPHRLMATFLLEGLMLATAASFVAVLLSYILGGVLLKLLFPTELATPTNWLRSGAVAAVLLCLSGLATAIAPSIQAWRSDIAMLLRHTPAKLHGVAMRQEVLVALQLMLSGPLVVAAILLAQSFWQLNHVSLGFRSRGVFVLPLVAPNDTISSRDLSAFSQLILARVGNVQGITAASTSFGGPFAGAMFAQVSLPGNIDLAGDAGSYVNSVSSEYFSVLGIPVLRGRVFTAEDDRNPSPAIAVVNERFAHTFWPGSTAIGKCLLLAAGSECTRVIGVVGDTKLISMWEHPIPQLFVPRSEASLLPVNQLILFARATAGLAAVRRGLEQQLGTVLGSDKLLWAQSLDGRIAPQTYPWHVGSVLFGVIALLALIIGAVGSLALAFHSAARREFEFAIRMAVGATSRDLVWLALFRSLVVGVVGTAGGCILALTLTHSLGRLLIETGHSELLVFGMTGILMIGLVLAAAIVPVWRIAHAEPGVVLQRAAT
ncbi:MAG: ABC transporter permease [Gemmatimonadaceae bacterium]